MKNSVQLDVRLIREPEIKPTRNGEEMVRARGSFICPSGRSGYITLVAFGGTGVELFRSLTLTQGCQVLVTGALEFNEWTDAEGRKRSELQLVPFDMELLARPPVATRRTPAPEAESAE